MAQFHPRRIASQQEPRQSGFTLVEVMVAIVILSFGLLGVAALMVNGLQYTHSAQQRSLATVLAYDLIDRMRSNVTGVALGDIPAGGGNYNRPVGNPSGSGSPYKIPQASCVAATAVPSGTCGAGNMADQDVYEWELAVQARLGSGVGIVCRDSSNSAGTYDGTTIVHGCDGVGPKYAIKVYWLDDRASAANAGLYQVFLTTFIP